MPQWQGACNLGELAGEGSEDAGRGFRRRRNRPDGRGLWVRGVGIGGRRGEGGVVVMRWCAAGRVEMTRCDTAHHHVCPCLAFVSLL